MFTVVPPFISVTSSGNGTFVEIVKGILDAMTPTATNSKIDVTPCLPSPSVPNTDRYAQICEYIHLLSARFSLILLSNVPFSIFSYNGLDLTYIWTLRTQVEKHLIFNDERSVTFSKLRLRQIVMNQLYPEKANERAAWLCNQIIKKRISFAKFARRKIRSQFRNDASAKNLTFLNFLRVKLNR